MSLHGKMYYIDIKIEQNRYLISICISIHHLIFYKNKVIDPQCFGHNEKLFTHQEKCFLN